MNFYADVCTDKDHCIKACEGTAVWDGMTQKIKQTISQSGFAVSFHWAPSYFPHTMVYNRLSSFAPGALLWNNCHHWIGHGQAVAEPVKMNLWLSYVDSSAAVLEKLVGLQTLSYQGCTRTLCEGGYVESIKDMPPDFTEQCHARKQWLEKANDEAKKLIVTRGMRFIDLHALLPDDVLKVAFLDGTHPCMPIPCMWQNSQVYPPRQCCQSLLVHSVQSLGGAPGAANSSWDVPTLASTGGNHSFVQDDIMSLWDEATPKEISPVNAMI
jgi:hypothetical protein